MKKALIFLSIIIALPTFADLKSDPNLWINLLMDQALQARTPFTWAERSQLVDAQSAGMDRRIPGMEQLSSAGYIVLDSDVNSHAAIVVRVIKKGEKVFENINPENPSGRGVSPGAIEIGIVAPVDEKMAKDIAHYRNNPLDKSMNYLDPENPLAILIDRRIRPESHLVTLVSTLATDVKMPWNSVRQGTARVFEIEYGKYVAVRNVRINLPSATPAQVGQIISSAAFVAGKWLKDYPNYNVCLTELTDPQALPLRHRPMSHF